MKEQRGPLGRTVEAVTQGMAGAARRRRAEREPRVTVYDAGGQPTLLDAGDPTQQAVVECAERLVEAALGSRSRGRGEPATDPEQPADGNAT